jgi:8-oxo-dGTP pyrophosphatase MutT (NUDIX family)
MERQFTACAYILDQERERVLLIYHRKMKKWLPPGGHLEPNETPAEGAVREAKEETGLDVALIQQENVWIERWNANSFVRPYMCLLEEIPAFGEQKAHQHVDFIYLAVPVGGEEVVNHHETGGMRWFTPDEIEQLAPDEEIFVETQQAIHSIFCRDPIGGQKSLKFTG